MKDWNCRDAQTPSWCKRRKVLPATYVSVIDLKQRESKPYCGDTFHWYRVQCGDIRLTAMHHCERNLFPRDVRGGAASNVHCRARPTDLKGKRGSRLLELL